MNINQTYTLQAVIKPTLIPSLPTVGRKAYMVIRLHQIKSELYRHSHASGSDSTFDFWRYVNI